jgi:hypothetical protein
MYPKSILLAMLSLAKSLVGTSLSNISERMGIFIGSKQESTSYINKQLWHCQYYSGVMQGFMFVKQYLMLAITTAKERVLVVWQISRSKKGGAVDRPLRECDAGDRHANDIAVTGQLSTAC